MAAVNGPGPKVPIDASEAEMKLRQLKQEARELQGMLAGLPEPSGQGAGPLAQSGRLPTPAARPPQARVAERGGVGLGPSVPAPPSPRQRARAFVTVQQAQRASGLAPSFIPVQPRAAYPNIDLVRRGSGGATIPGLTDSVTQAVRDPRTAALKTLSRVAGPLAKYGTALFVTSKVSEQAEGFLDNAIAGFRSGTDSNGFEAAQAAVTRNITKAVEGFGESVTDKVRSVGKAGADLFNPVARAGAKGIGLAAYGVAEALNAIFDSGIDSKALLKRGEDAADLVTGWLDYQTRSEEERIAEIDAQTELAAQDGYKASNMMFGMGLPGTRKQIALEFAKAINRRDKKVQDLSEAYADELGGIDRDERFRDRIEGEIGKVQRASYQAAASVR